MRGRLATRERQRCDALDIEPGRLPAAGDLVREFCWQSCVHDTAIRCPTKPSQQNLGDIMICAVTARGANRT